MSAEKLPVAGVSVEATWMVECTHCGGVVGAQPKRGDARKVAAEHATHHLQLGHRSRRFASWSAAQKWAGLT